MFANFLLKKRSKNISVCLISCLIITCYVILKKFSINFKKYEYTSNLVENSQFVSSCKNSVRQFSSVAIVTQVHDDEAYALASIKLLSSIAKNTSPSIKYDKIILELIEKPIKSVLKKSLINSGWSICEMNRIPPRDEENTYPRFRQTFARLLLWNMTEYESILFMDTDTLVIGNIDFLFSISNLLNSKGVRFAATRDISAGEVKETFNAGVHVLLPSKQMFENLMKLKNDTNFKFHTTMADQGFLNEALKGKWHDFGFIYNANLAYYTQKRNFWDKNAKDIRIIHYTMEKPWNCGNTYKDVCDLWRNFN